MTNEVVVTTHPMTKATPTLSDKQTKSMKDLTVSGKIRFLDKEGFSRGDISRILGKRYQHVRNVLMPPLKGSK